MLANRKEQKSFVSTDSGNIGPIEEGFQDFPQIQIQKKPKSSHSILSIMIFLLPFLLANKVDSNEFSFFDKRPNSPKIKLIIKYLAFFGEFILAKATFEIIIDIFIISINILKSTREGSEKTLTYQRAGIARKIHFHCENGLFGPKNDSKNICELNNDKKIISDLISIDENLYIEGQKYYTRSFILLSYILIKNKFQLGINEFFIINRYSYIYIIQFRFFNQSTNQKNIFSKISFDFTQFLSSKDDGYFYFIKDDIILTDNNAIDELNNTFENFMQIKIIIKNNIYESFKSKFTEFIIYNIDDLLRVSKRKINSIRFKDYITLVSNNIFNILDNENIFVYLLNLINEIIIDIYYYIKYNKKE